MVIGTAVFVRPIQLSIQERMGQVRDGLILRAESFLGRTITYASIGPSIFGTLDIRNFRLSGNGGKPVITVAKIRISYSFFYLIQGRIMESLRMIRLDRPALALDAEGDKDLLTLFSPENFSESFPMPDRIRIWIRNGNAEVVSPANRFKAEGLTLDASLGQGRIRFQGKGNLGLTLGELLWEPFSVRLGVKLSGESAADFQSGSATLSMASFADETVRFQPITINLTVADNKIAMTKINDQSAFDLSADYDITAGQMTSLFRCDGFSPKDFIAFGGHLKDQNQWLSFKTSGNVSFNMNRNREFRYSLHLYGSLPAGIPIKNASFVMRAEGDQNSVDFDELAVHLAQGSLRYHGSLGFAPFAPEGFFSFYQFGLSETDRINGRVTVHSQDQRIDFRGTALAFGERSFADFRGSAQVDAEGLTFETALIPGRAVSSGLFLQGFYDFGSSPYAEMNLTVRSLEGDDIIALISPFKTLPDSAGLGLLRTFSLNSSVYIATDFKHISYYAPNIAVIAPDRNELFRGILSGTERRFQLNQGQVTWQEEDIILTGGAEFEDPQNISFTIDATYFDKYYRLNGTLLDRNSLSIQGLHGVRFYLSAAEDGGYSGFFEADNVPIPYRGRPGRFSANASLRYESPEAWSLQVDAFELADLFATYSANPLGTALRISGGADQEGADFRNIFFDDGRGPLSGAVTASWEEGFSSIIGSISLRNGEGNEWYTLTGGFKDKSLSLRLTGRNMQIGRFTENSFNAVATGSAELVWNSRDSFSGKLNAAALTARVLDTDVSVQGVAALDNTALTADGLSLKYGNIQADIQALTVNRRTGRADAQARLQIAGGNTDISFSLGALFNPIDSWFHLHKAADSFDGILSVDSGSFNGIAVAEPFDFVFSRNESAIALSGGPRDMIRFRMTNAGDFYAGLSAPSPVRGTIIGAVGLKENVIDVQTQDLYIDLTALWRFIPSEAKNVVTINGGFVTASLRIAGPLGDPEFFGTLHGNSVRLGVPQFLTASVSPVPMTVRLEGNEMSFGPTLAAVGMGTGTVSGTFRFDRWVPDTFDLNIRVPQEQAIPFGFDISGIVSYGKASGWLKLSMQDRVFT
ncbi:MAG: hypothetical protein LBG73_06890, partial [Spirochaetaceae bacterium]|nr:hypothetical protein [Spirochaetaceae bacterium]